MHKNKPSVKQALIEMSNSKEWFIQKSNIDTALMNVLKSRVDVKNFSEQQA